MKDENPSNHFSLQEIDDYWRKCDWLKDKFSLSWQVVPTAIDDMLSDSNPARAQRVMNALLPMKKLDLAAHRRAYA